MASILSKEILPATAITATFDSSTDDNDAGYTGKKDLLLGDINFIGLIKVTGASSANYAVKLQHSHNGVDWIDLLSFTAVTANVVEAVPLDNTTTHVMSFVKAVLTRTAGSATFTIDLLHDRRRG